jgi:hypothetical protein
MIQVGATGIVVVVVVVVEEEDYINSVHTEKIDPLSAVVAKLVLPLTAFLLVSHTSLG